MAGSNPDGKLNPFSRSSKLARSPAGQVAISRMSEASENEAEIIEVVDADMDEGLSLIHI